VWVCHMPPGNPENMRTLGIEFGSVGDHLAHGDFLGTCEFLNSGGLSRAASKLHERRMASNPTADQLLRERNATVPPTWSAMTANVSSRTPAQRTERSTAPAKERRKKHLVMD